MIPTAAQSTPNIPRRRYRVQAVRRWGLSRGKPLASNASYYPNGALKQFTYGNGIVHTMTQNARQLPSRSTDGSVLDLATSFDANGNVSAVTDYTASARQTKAMAYDGLDRLTRATSPMFGTATYSYDTQDNLTQASLSGGSLPRSQYYCYSANNQLEFVRSGPQCTGNASPATTALRYDVQGNLASKNGTAYSFDTGNRLRSTANQTYRYDADGRRVRSDSAGAQLQYSQYAKDGRLLWQRDEVSGKRINNVYLAGSLLAEIARTIGSTTPTISYFHTDALGSPIAKTNSAGAVIETSEYEPYGRLGNRQNDNRAGYTGHVMDSASGLTYMQARYFDSQLGIFDSVDPVSATSIGGNFNRYWYGADNPYRFIDPDGRVPRDEQDRRSNASSSPCGGGIICSGRYESSGDGSSQVQTSKGNTFYKLPQNSGEGGFYNYGTPIDGEGQYGTGETLSLIFKVGQEWVLSGEERYFGVGNMSLRNGGPFPPHSSHRNGYDIDIRAINNQGVRQGGITWRSPLYDRAATQRLVDIFLATNKVKVVYFNDPQLRGVVPMRGHDDHFHVGVKP